MKKIEISVRELVIYTAKKWYVIIAVMLAVSVIFGQYSSRKQEQARLAIQAAYEQDLAAYQAEVEANKDKVKVLAAQKQSIEDYLANSILMSINPYDYAIGSLSLDVNTEDNNASILNRISDHYVELVRSAPLAEVLEGIVPENLKESYLQDAIKVVKVNNDIVSIRAIVPDGIDALAVVDKIGNYVSANKDKVAASAAEHTLSVIRREAAREADRALVDQRVRQQNALTAIDKLLDASTPVEPEQPTEEAINAGSKYFMGAIGGIALGVLVLLSVYFMRLPLQYPEQLEQQLGIRYLGKYQHGAGEAEKTTATKLIVANLREAAPTCKRVLMLGSTHSNDDAAAIKVVKGIMLDAGFDVVTSSNIRSNPMAVEALANADCVILAVQLQHSRVREVFADYKRVELAAAKATGYVVL